MNESKIMQRIGKGDRAHQILVDRARNLARVDDAQKLSGEELDLITFQVGGERFGVDIQFVQEVQPLTRNLWTLVPCTPGFIVGAVNIRGRIYTMMNIAVYLDIQVDSSGENAHTLLVRDQSRGNNERHEVMEFCLQTEDIPRLESIPPGDLQPPSDSVSARAQKYIKGITRDLVMVLDLEKLFADPGIIVNEESNGSGESR